MDRHKLWRRIVEDYEEAKGRAPEGFRPVVLVYIRSRVKPLELGFVRTSRDPEYPWVRFELTGGVRPGEEAQPYHRSSRVYVHEKDIQHVELQMREAPAFDFHGYEVLDDTPEPPG